MLSASLNKTFLSLYCQSNVYWLCYSYTLSLYFLFFCFLQFLFVQRCRLRLLGPWLPLVSRFPFLPSFPLMTCTSSFTSLSSSCSFPPGSLTCCPLFCPPWDLRDHDLEVLLDSPLGGASPPPVYLLYAVFIFLSLPLLFFYLSGFHLFLFSFFFAFLFHFFFSFNTSLLGFP